MGRSRVLFSLVVSASVTLVFAACSSVPDIYFVDGGGGGDSGASSGAVDAATDQGGPPPPSCANGVGAPAGGICCGTIPCIGCDPSECNTCDAQCRVSTGACCKRGQNIQCRPESSCK